MESVPRAAQPPSWARDPPQGDSRAPIFLGPCRQGDLVAQQSEREGSSPENHGYWRPRFGTSGRNAIQLGTVRGNGVAGSLGGLVPRRTGTSTRPVHCERPIFWLNVGLAEPAPQRARTRVLPGSGMRRIVPVFFRGRDPQNLEATDGCQTIPTCLGSSTAPASRPGPNPGPGKSTPRGKGQN